MGLTTKVIKVFDAAGIILNEIELQISNDDKNNNEYSSILKKQKK